MIRAVDKWLAGYIKHILAHRRNVPGPRHFIFCMADHFEPFRGGVSHTDALKRVNRWRTEYSNLFKNFKDSDGKGVCHTFFYPQEEYNADCLDVLSEMFKCGYGEVEIHLHHRNDTPEGFRSKLEKFRDVLREKHGLLGSDPGGRISYGFIHGNWALCNSRSDGDWCGVNEELGILKNTGCYADFTFPSAPSSTQSRIVNSIYYAGDISGKQRSYDWGIPVKVKKDMVEKDAEALMLITGPLGLNWARRKWWILPRLENGEISAANPPLSDRITFWERTGIHVAGRPDWIFVKVYTHGCVSENMDALLGEPMRKAHDYLMENYNDGKNWLLHYVTAREMYNIVRAAEEGMSGNPGSYRDYEISPPTGMHV